MIYRLPQYTRNVIFSCLLLLTSACGDVASRDDFNTAAIGKSGEEVEQRFGKPDAVESGEGKQTKWIYKHKTFDMANQNKVDSKTIVTLESLSDGGKLSVTRVDFAD